MDSKTYQPGDRASVEPVSIGTRYADGGVDISNATRQGAALIGAGVGYICPHGIACSSLWDRESQCEQCAAADGRV